MRLLSGVKNESVQNYSVQHKGYNLIGVTTVKRGDGSNDSTDVFLYIRQLYSWDCTLYMYINKSHNAAVRQCSSAETGLPV